MKIIIIRHGDPDYEHDSLTEKGWREAELLSLRISKMDVKDFYVSPLGRAKDTASLTLKKMNRTATECDWLREFEGYINRPDVDHLMIPWDWLPQDWVNQEEFYRCEDWKKHPLMQEGRAIPKYEWVTSNLDELLAAYGYKRQGKAYQVQEANTDTLVFFCHFGLECVLLSHLTNISPMLLWHHFCAAPASVTTLITEERRKGIATFRMSGFGDISHLYAAGEEPSVSARFCETYDNMKERHD